VPVRPAQEGEDVVVDDVADAGGQAGADERELAILTECVLHGGGELAQLHDLVVVDFV